MIEIKPRGKGKLRTDIKTVDLYNYYKSNLSTVESIAGGETQGKYNIKAKLYSDILKDLNQELKQLIIFQNFELILPYRLGTLSIIQKKTKLKLDSKGELVTRNLAINWKATKDLWKQDETARLNETKIFHLNEHSDGNKMFWKWSKLKSKVEGIYCYMFIPSRTTKRYLASCIKDRDNKLQFYTTKPYNN